MKRILLSLVCGIASVIVYFILLGVLYQIFQLKFSTLMTLLEPINFPYNIYKTIFGLYRGDPRAVKVLTLAADIMICAIPFYVLFTLVAKQKHEHQGVETPPEPPVFH